MTPKTFEITVRKRLSASPSDVWATFADPDAYSAIHGCHETKIDFREGGAIETVFFPDKPHGETFVLLDLDPPNRLLFAWEGSELFAVTVEIEARDDGCEIAITQNCQDDPDWMTNCLDGWAWIVDSMESWFATGRGIPNDEWSEKHGTHRVVRRGQPE